MVGRRLLAAAMLGSMLLTGAAKCGSTFDVRGLPVQSRQEWLLEPGTDDIVIGYYAPTGRRLHPEIRDPSWVLIGWSGRRHLPVWMPRHRQWPSGGSGP